MQPSGTGKALTEHGLLELLVGGSIPRNAQIQSYLAHISSLSLPELTREPTTLANEASHLNTELNNLCQRDYSTFLHVHSTSQSLSASFDSFAKSLTSLIDCVPDLEAQCHTFSLSTKEIQSERRKATLILEHHDKLLDVLEIPQLIETCVRNGYYQEAIDLSTHSASLAKRFPDVQVIRDLQAEVEHLIRLMLSQLLSILRQPAKLPVLVKTVNFLRRIGDFDEKELALAFLTSRKSNLDSMLAGIEKGRVEPAVYVRKYIDVFREGLYDLVTQYIVVFLDRSTSPNSTADLRHLLAEFTHHLIAGLLELLDATLPQIDDPTALTALLTKLTYCATSFSRIGLDFRPLLPPSFSTAIRTSTSRSLFAAASSLCTTILDAQKSSRLPSTWLATAAAVSSPPVFKARDYPVHVPPQFLSSYPPLAIYSNSLFTTLNTLRLLPPIELVSQLISLFNKSLYTTVSAFLAYSQAIIPISANSSKRKSFEVDEKERAVVIGAGVALVKLLVPLVKRGLVEGVYGMKLEDLPVNADHDDELDKVIRQWEDWHKEVERDIPNGVVTGQHGDVPNGISHSQGRNSKAQEE